MMEKTFEIITAHCRQIIRIRSTEELVYEKIRCPHCNQLISQDN